MSYKTEAELKKEEVATKAADAAFAKDKADSVAGAPGSGSKSKSAAFKQKLVELKHKIDTGSTVTVAELDALFSL